MQERQPPPDARPASGSRWFAITFAVAGTSIAALMALANADGSQPPTTLLAACGIVVATVGAVCVGLAVQANGLPLRISIALAGGFVCIAIAKFTFGPLGFYEMNQERSLVTGFPMDPSMPIVVLTGVAVFALYFGALWLIFAGFRTRLPERADWRPLTPGIVAVVLGSSALFLAATILLGVGAQDYLELVFSSSAALAVGVSILLAAALVAVAFGSASDALRAAGQTATYVSLFSVALGFLVVFHVLWVVYMLVLISIWPLRTVTPK